MTALADSEAALQAFVARLPDDSGRAVRTLAHAWSHAGGTVQVGTRSVRLMETDAAGNPCTVGTLYAEQEGAPRLEILRVNLQRQGLAQGAWDDWCDERQELCPHGFDPASKYPGVRLDGLEDAPLLRLAVGLRDLHLAIRS